MLKRKPKTKQEEFLLLAKRLQELSRKETELAEQLQTVANTIIGGQNERAES